MKILIVDDEVVGREKMKKIMETYGECIVVQNGTDAILSFETALKEGKTFDLISLDIELPDMRGIEVLKKIREIEKQGNPPSGKPVKIMMVTASKVKTVVLECIKAGCNDYIAKPFDKELIAPKLKKMGFNVSETPSG